MNDGILNGRVAIVTGGSQGLGLEVAKRFVAEGARVTVCARSEGDVADAVQGLKECPGPFADEVQGYAVDVARVDDVTRLVDAVIAKDGCIDILVNNAGIYGPMGAIDGVSMDDWIQAIEVNLFGSVNLVRAVIPHMKKAAGGKIIQLSGGGATSPMPMISAYAASKAAVVRFAESVAGEVAKFGIDINSVAPGALNTRMLNEVLGAGPDLVGGNFFERSEAQNSQGGTPLSVPTDLITFLASAESNGVTGKLISAVWDPWSTFPVHRDDLNQTDVYTIRRIVPSDRGLSWGIE